MCHLYSPIAHLRFSVKIFTFVSLPTPSPPIPLWLLLSGVMNFGTDNNAGSRDRDVTMTWSGNGRWRARWRRWGELGIIACVNGRASERLGPLTDRPRRPFFPTISFRTLPCSYLLIAYITVKVVLFALICRLWWSTFWIVWLNLLV